MALGRMLTVAAKITPSRRIEDGYRLIMTVIAMVVRKFIIFICIFWGTRSKAIGIARNVGAQYVLYSNATGNVNTPALQMQLMLVQTGEIIWSGKGAVTQQ